MPAQNTRSRCLWFARLGATVAVIALVGACSGEKRRAERAAEPIKRDIPSALRGIIGAECTFRGVEPQLVSGFGILVGLNGTGSGYLDPGVRQTMERELARGGVTRGNAQLGEIGRSPDEFLRDPSVAVVIVEAAIPPGAPKGAMFDVRVRALPNSGVTSIEGGVLWTTDLRIGPATTMTGVKTRILAEARGQVFINPFAEPGAEGQDTVNRTSGRILNGGRVTDPLKIELVLDNESHTRSRAIVAAINTRFPEGRMDDGPTASGRTSNSIAIQVPTQYRDEASEFIGLLRHLNIDQSYPQELARRYVEDLKAYPELAEEIAACIRAVGPPAVPFLKEMYDFPQVGPRMAALEAGAKLGDPRVMVFLEQIALEGQPAYRVPAIQLMALLPRGMDASLTLRELLNAKPLDVRIAAYETMTKRADSSIDRIVVADDPRLVKFLIDIVPAKEPLIYITQQGQPRIVLFGGTGEGFGARRDSIKLSKPLLVSAWSDRLLINAPQVTSPVQVMYRDTRTGRVVRENTVPEQLAALLTYFAHTPTPENPEPGLGFTYSETVGALYEIYNQQAVDSLFATEADRLRAAVWDAAKTTVMEDRPETDASEKDSLTQVFEPEAPKPEEVAAAAEAGPKTLVKPLPRKTKKQ